MSDLFHGDGFLGTNANFLADFGLILVVAVSLLFTVGAVLALRKQYEAHKWVQTAAVILNVILVLWLMVGPYYGEVVREWGAEPYPAGFFWVPTVHAIFGVAALAVGFVVTLRGHEAGFLPAWLKFNNYKLYMRLAYGLYMVTTLLGIGVYVMWFIISPLGPVYE